MVTIEKDIPVKAERASYPFGGMDVGDSFAFGPNDYDVAKLRIAAHNYGAYNGSKFSVLKDGNRHRCWRLS